jgi:hypothetical protein
LHVAAPRGLHYIQLLMEQPQREAALIGNFVLPFKVRLLQRAARRAAR